MEGRVVRSGSRIVPWILIAGGLLLAGIALWFGPGQEIPPPPHPVERGKRSLLLITLDTTRADHLSPYGAEDVSTPTLARLAAEGILFERATSVAPITLVAHTSILTGLYPFQHGVRNNGLHHLSPEQLTLAEQLGRAGYRTAAFVSAAVLERRYGLDQGFELYDDDLSTGRQRRPRMVPDRPAEAVVEAARQWLDQLRPGERFFLWVHFYDPHSPYSPPPPYRDRYRERLYDGEIAYMDAQISRLLEHPRVGEETVVAVMGDHGESLGEHGEQTHALLAYESTLQVPFLVKIPGGPAGQRIRQPVGQVDLLPTLLDLFQMEWPHPLPGRSLLPLVEGRRGLPETLYYGETYLPYYTYGWAKLKVARLGNWKYIQAPQEELYDLHRDPRELTNLIEQEPDLGHDLRRALEELLARYPDPEREASLELDSEAADRLRSLGYLAMGSRPLEREGERPDPKAMIGLHVRLEAARRFLQDRLFEQAIASLLEVLRRDPHNLAALVDLAAAYREQERLQDALQILQRALELDPDYPRLYLLLAQLENQRGERERALELVDTALRLDPRSVEASMQKANLLQQAGREAEAQRVLEATLQVTPEHPGLNILYAQLVEIPQQRWEEGEQRLRAALKRDPFLVHGWRALGNLLERRGRLQEALQAFREGLRRQPDEADLHARLGLLLARSGGPPETEHHLREALRLGSHFRSDLHVALGAWLAEQGRLEEAQRHYDQVLQTQPGHPAALNNRAVALYRSGRRSEAKNLLEQLLRRFPRHADAYNNLAAIFLDEQEWGRSEEASRQALELNPELTEAWNNLGVAVDEQGRLEEAEGYFRKALELDPHYLPARLNLAINRRRAGQFDTAVQLLEELLQQAPGAAEAHWELGNLYAGALQRPERARIHLQAFLKARPRDPRANQARSLLEGLGPSAR